MILSWNRGGEICFSTGGSLRRTDNSKGKIASKNMCRCEFQDQGDLFKSSLHILIGWDYSSCYYQVLGILPRTVCVPSLHYGSVPRAFTTFQISETEPTPQEIPEAKNRAKSQSSEDHSHLHWKVSQFNLFENKQIKLLLEETGSPMESVLCWVSFHQN